MQTEHYISYKKQSLYNYKRNYQHKHRTLDFVKIEKVQKKVKIQKKMKIKKSKDNQKGRKRVLF